jgi:hypothetical protein
MAKTVAAPLWLNSNEAHQSSSPTTEAQHCLLGSTMPQYMSLSSKYQIHSTYLAVHNCFISQFYSLCLFLGFFWGGFDVLEYYTLLKC